MSAMKRWKWDKGSFHVNHYNNIFIFHNKHIENLNKSDRTYATTYVSTFCWEYNSVQHLFNFNFINEGNCLCVCMSQTLVLKGMSN